MLRYDDFMLESAKGMRLFYSEDFRNILKKIYAKYDGVAERIAGILILQEDGGQSNYPYSLIDVTEKNDMISFVQANRYLKDFPEGDRPDKVNKYWKNGRTPEYSIGKFAQFVMRNVDKEVPGAQLEEFVNAYRAQYDLAQKAEASTFELVSGEDMVKYYLETSFVDKKDYGGHDSLHGSCMRKKECASYFGLYTNNPEVCSLLVMLDSEGRTMGRALIWTLEDGKRYMDRIYCVDSNTNIGKFHDWGKSNGIEYYQNIQPTLPPGSVVEVKPETYEKYPYLDTFCYYDPENGILSASIDNSDGILYLRSTFGSGDELDDHFKWSRTQDEWIDVDDACYCEDIDDWMRVLDSFWLEYKGIWVSNEAEVRYSEYDEGYYLEEDCEYSDMMSDYIDEDDAIKVIVSADGEWDWCHKEETALYVKVDDEYYSKDYTFDPYTKEWTFELGEIQSRLKKEYVESGVARGSSGKFDKAMLRQDTRQMLIGWKGYSTSLQDFVAELFEGVDYKYSVYVDIGMPGWTAVITGLNDLVPSFIEYLVDGGFDSHSQNNVANIAAEIYGDEKIEPKLSRNAEPGEKVKVGKARLAAECFRLNPKVGKVFGSLNMPKLLDMPEPGEDLYKRWLLLRK